MCTNVQLKTGNFYFISNAYFKKMQDPYLKRNHKTTMRPHLYVFKEGDLYWMVPCSTQVEKYEKIIRHKQDLGLSTEGIQIIQMFGEKRVLLFQDMVPVSNEYIVAEYKYQGKPVRLGTRINKQKKIARYIAAQLSNGYKFTPTQANIKRIRRMLKEKPRPVKFHYLPWRPTPSVEPMQPVLSC